MGSVALYLLLWLLAFVVFVLGAVFAGLWAARDAKHRKVENPLVWGLLSGLLPVVGVIVYLFVRRAKPLTRWCPSCGDKVSNRAKYCPSCGAPAGGKAGAFGRWLLVAYIICAAALIAICVALAATVDSYIIGAAPESWDFFERFWNSWYDLPESASRY